MITFGYKQKNRQKKFWTIIKPLLLISAIYFVGCINNKEVKKEVVYYLSSEEAFMITDNNLLCYPKCFVKEKSLKIEDILIQKGKYVQSCCNNQNTFNVLFIYVKDTTYIIDNNAFQHELLLKDFKGASYFFGHDFIPSKKFIKIDAFIKNISVVLAGSNSTNKDYIVTQLINLLFYKGTVSKICPYLAYDIKPSYGSILDSLRMPEAFYQYPQCITLVPDEQALYYLMFSWNKRQNRLDFYYLNNPFIDYSKVFW